MVRHVCHPLLDRLCENHDFTIFGKYRSSLGSICHCTTLPCYFLRERLNFNKLFSGWDFCPDLSFFRCILFEFYPIFSIIVRLEVWGYAMKMKQLVDSTIKITIQLGRLRKNGMEIAGFCPTRKQKNFSTLFWWTRNAESFRGMLSFRVTPNQTNWCFCYHIKIDQQLDLRICQIFLIWKSCRALRQMNLSKPWKQSLIRQKGMQKPFTIWKQEELRDNQEQDPTSEAPVSHIFITFCVFKYPAVAKTVSFPVDTSQLYKMIWLFNRLDR